jgi:hypothetical protein
MKKAAIAMIVISAVAAFVCLSVNVDTKDIGGIIGPAVVQPDTPAEHINQTRRFLRIAGIGWIGIGILGLTWAVRSSGR